MDLQIDKNYLLIIIGIAAIILEILMGVATGFDLLLIGIIFILSGIFGMAVKSFTVGLIGVVVLSFFYILFGRRLIRSKLAIETQKTNIDNIIGQKGVVVKKIAPHHPGQIKIGGEIWRAESTHGVEIKQEVIVKSVSGVTLQVEP